MANLPVEVSSIIFSFLLQRDQLECMTVCRQWYNVIYNHTLFRYIFFRSQEQYDKLIDKLEQDPLSGKNVERLILWRRYNSDYDTETLTKRFPNLYEFTLTTASVNYIRHQPSRAQIGHPWCERIQKITETTDEFHTKTLLLSGTCKNLTSISVNGSHTSGSHLVKALANAPALRILHLTCYDISCQDLEVLHETVPLLNSLSLRNTTVNDTSTPLNINPATLMRCFSYRSDMIEYRIDGNPYIPYIGQKYTHLDKLTLQIDRVDMIPPSGQFAPIDWLGPPGFNEDKEEEEGEEEESEEEEENEDEFTAIMEQKRVSVQYYLASLPRSLKELALENVELDRNGTLVFDFSMLDNAGCQIQRLNLLNFTDIPTIKLLTRTSQVSYIRSLTIRLIGDRRKTYTSLDWIKCFRVLKELSIKFPVTSRLHEKYTLSLTNLMDALSEIQVETFKLYGVHLMRGQSTIPYTYPSLKKLTFSRVRFGEDTDFAISEFFPNLQRLTLATCCQSTTTFTLSKTSISYLEVSFLHTFVKGPFNVLVSTLNNNQQRLYIAVKSLVVHSSGELTKQLPFPYCHSRPYDVANDVWFLHIICKTLYDMSITNRSF